MADVHSIDITSTRTKDLGREDILAAAHAALEELGPATTLKGLRLHLESTLQRPLDEWRAELRAVAEAYAAERLPAATAHDPPTPRDAAREPRNTLALQASELRKVMARDRANAASRRALEQHRLNVRFLVDPRTSKRIAGWDAVTAIALVFTALCTPFEVAYVPEPQSALEGWFVVNRLVDAIFVRPHSRSRSHHSRSRSHHGRSRACVGRLEMGGRSSSPRRPASTAALLSLAHPAVDPSLESLAHPPLVPSLAHPSSQTLAHPSSQTLVPKIVDFVLQFFLMYMEPTTLELAARWVSEHRKIVSHYLHSPWFALDLSAILVSIFDYLALANAQAQAHARTSGSASRATNLSAFKVLRVLRALRLIKLLRLLRGSRILKRWEVRIAINYAMLEMATLIGKICFACHLFACIWALQASFSESKLDTWMGAGGYCYSCAGAGELSTSALAKCPSADDPAGHRVQPHPTLSYACVSGGTQYSASL